MIYLEKFVLPDIEVEEELIGNVISENGGYIDSTYPCYIFTRKNLQELDFAPITILYGGNGSGKSTLLNVIAEKFQLNRIAPYNQNKVFKRYAKLCKYRMGYDEEGFKCRMPNGSRIITSDDVFDYMLTLRTSNEEFQKDEKSAEKEYAKLRSMPTIKFDSNNYEEFRKQVWARDNHQSRRKFIMKTVGEEFKLNSNGETAFEYFQNKLKNERLYCLDEPENSLSPKLQIKLKEYLEEMSRYCGCQFIISTHSPFLLALQGAKIYDLDADPVTVKKWQQLENPKTYFEFFNTNKNLFE